MADRQKTSQVFGQVEYEPSGTQRNSQVFGQVEYEPFGTQRNSQVFGQVEYVDKNDLPPKGINLLVIT